MWRIALLVAGIASSAFVATPTAAEPVACLPPFGATIVLPGDDEDASFVTRVRLAAGDAYDAVCAGNEQEVVAAGPQVVAAAMWAGQESANSTTDFLGHTRDIAIDQVQVTCVILFGGTMGLCAALQGAPGALPVP